MLGSFNKPFKRGPIIPVLYVKETKKRKKERKGKKKEGSEIEVQVVKTCPGSHSKYMEEQGLSSVLRDHASWLWAKHFLVPVAAFFFSRSWALMLLFTNLILSPPQDATSPLKPKVDVIHSWG